MVYESRSCGIISPMQDNSNTNQTDSSIVPKRNIRSFVRREGRMTPAQARALGNDNQTIILPNASISTQHVFTQQAPLVVEIGFGMGESLIEMARSHPELNFIGIEVHRPGVGAALLMIEKLQLQNIRIFCQDAVTVFQEYLASASVDRVQIFFPDPWHKKRHHKRRLIQVAFIRKLMNALKPKAKLHIVTDWQEYAEYIQTELNKIPELVDCQQENESQLLIAQRPRSKYESRAIRLEHEIFNFIVKPN